MVQESDFYSLLDEVFGRAYGRSIIHDQRIDKLGTCTALEALAQGVQPRVVWNALCDHMEIPDSKRWGSATLAPPMPAK